MTVRWPWRRHLWLFLWLYQSTRNRWQQRFVVSRRWLPLIAMGISLAVGGAEMAAMDACRAAGAPFAAEAAVIVVAFACLLAVAWCPLQVVSVLLPRCVGRRVYRWENPYAPPPRHDWASGIRAEPPEWTEIDHWEFHRLLLEVRVGVMQLEIEQYLRGEDGQQQ